MNYVGTDWLQEYREAGALWTHDGNPKRPHAILGSGWHSVGYFRSEYVAQDPVLLEGLSNALIDGLVENGLDLSSIDRVVGIAMSGVALSFEVARLIGERREVMGDRRAHICMRAYLEKVRGLDGKESLGFMRSGIASNDNILIVDDVFTTGSSLRLAMDAIEDAGGKVAPFVGVLVNRSGRSSVKGLPVVSVIEKSFDMWLPRLCPLCAQGSLALKPKDVSGANWKLLNGEDQRV